MEAIKRFILNWILQGKLKGLLKATDGYKTYVGALLSVVSIVVIAAGSHLPFADSVVQALDYLQLYFEQPLAPEEIQKAALALQLITGWLVFLWGVLHKLWKFATGKPQVPQTPKPVTLTLHKNPALEK